jgi:hypothetical protein
MKKLFTLIVLSICLHSVSAQNTIKVMDSVIFHDGYASYVTSPAPPLGAIKMRNDLFSRKLTNTEIESIGSKLQLNVSVSALCDNYDRIGNVFLALVPHDSATYTYKAVEHIEIARFITPFMNKNVSPKTVPYTFYIDNVAAILKDTELRKKYKFWIELAIFGVPYAANKEVSGCNGRNDVFMGKLDLVTNSPVPAPNTNVLMPLYFNANFNNYQEGATDILDITTKTLKFNVSTKLSDAAFFLITSNHGANAGGEEYNRRTHDVYFNNELKLSYIPGRPSCEPFRKYNTQGNGIYGSKARTPAEWQTFSNWCPGDVIDIRRINLGTVSAGEHTFKIEVPDAVFFEKQGNIPLSLYLHGTTSGVISNVESINPQENGFTIYPNPSNGIVNIKFDKIENKDAKIEIFNQLGQMVYSQNVITSKLDHLVVAENFANGIYFIKITTDTFAKSERILIEKN